MSKQGSLNGMVGTTGTRLGVGRIKSMRDVVNRVLERSGVHEVNTNASCVIPLCTGTIIQSESKKYFGDPSQAIIGPGYQNQLTSVVELFCSRCGVHYRHLPRKANE